MDFFSKGMNGDGSECPFDVNDIQRCPFLRNINVPTNFSFSQAKISTPVSDSSLCPSYHSRVSVSSNLRQYVSLFLHFNV